MWEGGGRWFRDTEMWRWGVGGDILCVLEVCLLTRGWKEGEGRFWELGVGIWY